ncbi:hypothetical protein FS837_012275 [Tulasnella sp. UAMH 9824]|nr:hypothetical protein FS837_012275 [Tulasnella sp. UAMH 9824]
MESHTSATAGESSVRPHFTVNNVFSIISRTTDASRFKQKYLAGPEWDIVHIIPDEPYNKTHRFSHYVAFCKSKDILNSAFLRLRLQEVTVHKLVNKQALKAVNPILRKLHGAEISDGIGTTFPSISESASTPTNPSPPETSPEQRNYHTQTWKQDLPLSPGLAFAIAASAASNDVVLPRTWSVKSRLPDVKDDDFVSASRAEALLLERKATLENLLTSHGRNSKLGERKCERGLERATSDLNSKREIEDFLNQYPDRPLVPEHWAYDTTLNTYVWKGPPVDRNGRELDLRTWKGFNF